MTTRTNRIAAAVAAVMIATSSISGIVQMPQQDAFSTVSASGVTLA